MIPINLSDIKDEKDLIPFGDNFFERSAKAKQRFQHQWLLNIAFIAGDQLVSVNRHTGNLDRVNVEYDPEWVVRVVDNRLLPIYRTMVAKLTKNKPIPSATANSKEESDIQAARGAVKLLENHWNLLELDAKHPELVGWLVATGNCFFKQYWNPKKGERVVDLSDMDTEAGLTPDGNPVVKTEATAAQVEFNLGDTDLVVRSPFNIYPQPGKIKMRDMTIFGDAEVMDVEEVESLYGKKVQAEKDTKLVRLHQNLEGAISGGRLEAENLTNSVTVKELYILPCKQFPNGFIYRWAGQTLLSYEEECQEIPITHFSLIDMPGQFWARGIIDDLINLQRRWNSLLSKIEMHNDFYCDPPILADPEVIDLDQWTSEPGLILEKLQPGVQNAVEVVKVPQLPQSVYKELEILDAQFEIVPILNKVSYGKETPNAKSGIAINFLQEKDDDVIRPLIENIEVGYADVFKRDFKLCQENYEEDRGFAIVGEDNEIEWVEFSKADLDANVDVGVEPGSAMPRSKVAQQAMVMDMLKAGFFTDPRTGRPDFAKALKYMEFGSVDDIYEESALDSNQAKRENERFKEGVFNPPEYWHNHPAHLYEHNRLRKTADYESFPPEVKQLIEQHVQMHMQFIQQEQAKQQPQQSATTPQQQKQSPAAQQPSEQELQAFIQWLQQNDPNTFAQIMQLPEQQRPQAILEIYQKVSQQANMQSTV